jgi:hypothetical protein
MHYTAMVSRPTAVSDFASSVLAEVIKRQPLSPGKIRLAWQVAAGAQLARATHIEIEGEPGSSSLALLVTARDARWTTEIERVRPMLQDRLSLLLGKSLTLRITHTHSRQP